MIERVISGGQSGVDLAGWRAARDAGLLTCGWMPKGFKAEDGAHPEYAEIYGARAHASASYRDRTIANVEMADAVLVLAAREGYFSPGSKLTRNVALELDRPIMALDIDRPPVRPPGVAQWINRAGFRSLMVAGNRESKAPGIGTKAEKYLAEVFRLMREYP